MTLDSQKMISRFLDSYFCTKFQISQPGWDPDQAIKIRHILTKLWLRGVIFHFFDAPTSYQMVLGVLFDQNQQEVTFSSYFDQAKSLHDV